jgi:hypothetical protein
MSTGELVALCEALPPEKREEVADFARFLLSRQSDERWEAILDDPRGYPKLEAFLDETSRETEEEFDHNRL